MRKAMWPMAFILFGFLGFVQGVGMALRVRPPLAGQEILFSGLVYGLFLAVAFTSALFLMILVHELGHYYAAKKVDFKAFEVKAAFLKWTKEGEKWKCRFDLEPRVGGYVLAFPVGYDNLQSRHRKFVAGGPLASFASASLMAAIFFVSALTRNYFIFKFAEIHLLAFALMAIVSWIPIQSAGMGSDAWWMLKLRKPTPEGEGLVSLLIVGQMIRDGRRLADMPPDLLAAMRQIKEPVMTVIQVSMLVTLHYLEREEDDAARAELARLNELAKGKKLIDFATTRIEIVCAMVALIADRDAAAAKLHLNRMGSMPMWNSSRLQIQSMIAWLEGEESEALRLAALGAQEAKVSPFHTTKSLPSYGRAMERISPALRQAAEESLGLVAVSD